MEIHSPRSGEAFLPNNSLEPTWPARILELRSALVLGWPGGSARGC
jgi:hypothetical protein